MTRKLTVTDDEALAGPEQLTRQENFQNSLPVDNERLVPSLVVCCRWPKVLQHLLDLALSQNVEFYPFRVNSCLM